jgi:hypothetical protein
MSLMMPQNVPSILLLNIVLPRWNKLCDNIIIISSIIIYLQRRSLTDGWTHHTHVSTRSQTIQSRTTGTGMSRITNRITIESLVRLSLDRLTFNL